jgi:hypothetical protein
MPRFLTVTALILATTNAFAGVSYSFRSTTKGLTSSTLTGTAESEGSNLRVQFVRGDGTLFRDGSVAVSNDGGKSIAVLDPKAKTYFVVPLGELSGVLGSTDLIHVTNPSVKVTDAGDGGAMEGMATRHLRLEAGCDLSLGGSQKTRMTMTGELWVTHALPPNTAGFLGGNGLRTGIEALDALIDAQGSALRGAFPLKEVMTVSAQGGVISFASSTTATVSNVRVRPIPPGQFVIPKGYVRVHPALSPRPRSG